MANHIVVQQITAKRHQLLWARRACGRPWSTGPHPTCKSHTHLLSFSSVLLCDTQIVLPKHMRGLVLEHPGAPKEKLSASHIAGCRCNGLTILQEDQI